MIYNIGIIGCVFLIFVWMIILSFGRTADKPFRTVLDVAITVLVVFAAVICVLYWRGNEKYAVETGEEVTVTERFDFSTESGIDDESANLQTEEQSQKEGRDLETVSDESAASWKSEKSDKPGEDMEAGAGKAEESKIESEPEKETVQNVTGQQTAEPAKASDEGADKENVSLPDAAGNQAAVDAPDLTEKTDVSTGNVDINNNSVSQEDVAESLPLSETEPDAASATETIMTGAE